MSMSSSIGNLHEHFVDKIKRASFYFCVVKSNNKSHFVAIVVFVTRVFTSLLGFGLHFIALLQRRRTEFCR